MFVGDICSSLSIQTVFTVKIYKITEEARFDWKHFLNIYKIAKGMKVMLEMFFKHSS